MKNKETWLSMREVEPIQSEVVLIKTSWSEYLATLRSSQFGGYEFHDCHSPKTMQTTVVRGWRPATTAQLKWGD